MYSCVTVQRSAGVHSTLSSSEINDYTQWFADDQEMAGNYFGYDGPCPPWNDERVHRYVFTLYALDLERCPVEGDFTCGEVVEAMKGHILAEAEWLGTYHIFPAARLA